jgi:hypothetical protein
MTTEHGPQEPAPDEDLVPADDTVIGKAFRWSLVVLAAAAALILAVVWLGRENAAVEEVVDRQPIAAPAPLASDVPDLPAVPFTDITQAAGIDFVHVNGAAGEKLLPETMGGGVAFLDHDADGDPDLLFVNSDHWPGVESEPRPTMRLYRNDGGGRFADVTRGSGLDVAFYGQGVAVGDFDNDGWSDVFISALGSNHLFRNTGGRFEDVTARAGLAGEADAWSTGAGFFDLDNDGDLDLFVCNYVRWSRDLDLKLNFTLNGIDRAYGPPKQYPGTHSYLYRNEGNGTFTDVSAASGIEVVSPTTGMPAGKALAVTFADADHDGYLDIFVANDTVQNFVFRNRRDGTFEEVGVLSGIAFDSQGNATGAMGIDAAEAMRERVLAIGIGNFANEATSFYVQQDRPWQFVDQANAAGIGSPSLLRLKFGLFFFDYDLDGRLDLLQANGHIEEEINEIQPSQHYRQAAQVFWNRGPAARLQFAAVPDAALGDLARPIVGRGAAFADIDADGDLDVVLTQAGGAPLLLRNDQRLGRHWLRVRLTGTASNRDAIGALVAVEAAGRRQRLCVMPTRSYLSQVETTLTFGLGEATQVERMTVSWPGGGTEEIVVPAVDREMRVTQAQTAPAAASTATPGAGPGGPGR